MCRPCVMALVQLQEVTLSHLKLLRACLPHCVGSRLFLLLLATPLYCTQRDAVAGRIFMKFETDLSE
jgi:hypothetical protein